MLGTFATIIGTITLLSSLIMVAFMIKNYRDHKNKLPEYVDFYIFDRNNWDIIFCSGQMSSEICKEIREKVSREAQEFMDSLDTLYVDLSNSIANADIDKYQHHESINCYYFSIRELAILGETAYFLAKETKEEEGYTYEGHFAVAAKLQLVELFNTNKNVKHVKEIRNILTENFSFFRENCEKVKHRAISY